jgi:hypothetical protein
MSYEEFCEILSFLPSLSSEKITRHTSILLSSRMPVYEDLLGLRIFAKDEKHLLMENHLNEWTLITIE